MNDNKMAAPTPPMGWNSWDCYMSAVTEEQILGNARYMREHLKPFGFQYIVCDIQWYEPLAGTVPGCEYIPFAQLSMDPYGRLLPAVNRFPSAKGGKGFKPLADQVHAMGLKFGIHIMRGIPRQAAHARCPVLGTEVTADRIANPFSICKWNSDMYGLLDVPGAQEYYKSLFHLYAEWGVDYVKVDDIANTNLYPSNPYSAGREIEMIRRAIDQCGRSMVLSLSPGPAVLEKAWHLRENAQMWRITDDFWDDWKALKAMFERCEVWQSHVGQGCWPDCDMLPLGRIGIAFGKDRQTRLTPDEQRTMVTLWSIFRSPLMLGGELRDTDQATLALLTNPEVIRVNQLAHSARQIRRDEREAVWMSDDPDGGRYLALFNLSDEERVVSADLPLGTRARDIWRQEDMGGMEPCISARLRPHACALYRLT